MNIDKSGSGSLSIFLDNLIKFDRHKGANVEIINGDSTDAGLDLVGKIGRGSMRFISIDGGHTTEHTVNDLIISQEIISNQGVVILDDILNYHWVGVIEGALKYLNASPTLVPFAIGMNKLFLCKLSFHEFYLSAFLKSKLATKKVKLVGHELVAL